MAPTLASRKNTETKDTHTHTPQAELHKGQQMAPNLASRKNIETKDTHTPLKQSYTGATKWPQPWQTEGTLKQRTHAHTPQAELHTNGPNSGKQKEH